MFSALKKAAYYKSKNMTLWDAMIAMYERYGYYKDDIKTFTLKGKEGLEKIARIMDALQKQAPETIGAYRVASARDYMKDTVTDLATGEVKPTGLPASKVLYYDLSDDAWVCVRPSGTEPKLKMYYGVKGASMEEAAEKSKALGKALEEIVEKID